MKPEAEKSDTGWELSAAAPSSGLTKAAFGVRRGVSVSAVCCASGTAGTLSASPFHALAAVPGGYAGLSMKQGLL